MLTPEKLREMARDADSAAQNAKNGIDRFWLGGRASAFRELADTLELELSEEEQTPCER